MQTIGPIKLNTYGVEVGVAKVLHSALKGGTPIEEIEAGLEAARISLINFCLDVDGGENNHEN